MLCRDSYVLKHMPVCPDASQCITSSWNPRLGLDRLRALCVFFSQAALRREVQLLRDVSASLESAACVVGSPGVCSPASGSSSLRLILARDFSRLVWRHPTKSLRQGCLAVLSWAEPSRHKTFSAGVENERDATRGILNKQGGGGVGSHVSIPYLSITHKHTHSLSVTLTVIVWMKVWSHPVNLELTSSSV